MNLWTTLSLGIVLNNAIAFPIKAQISPDGTTNTLVTPIDNGIRIDSGDRAGDNFFHSFEQFSIPNSSEAFFNNPNDIINIFSRVTGGNISNIDGLIRANGEANLFIINPAGIIFGEGAALNIGGSFFASTAESIVFTDDLEFAVTDRDNEPLLTINMPLGLNFGNNPGEITVNGSNLQVNSGENLALLGGNVTITGGESGFISAPGGRIELGGVLESGQITFNQEQLEELEIYNSIGFPEGVARADVILSNTAEVEVLATGGGSISINARNLEISGSNLRAGITSESNLTEAQAGDITLNATENITLSQGSRIDNEVEESGVGNSGKIDITTTNLFLRDGSLVSVTTRGKGDAGAIYIKASDTISLDEVDSDGFGSGIFSTVASESTGNSGEIDLTAAKLFLRQGGQIGTIVEGTGNAEVVRIETSNGISIDGEDLEENNSSIFSVISSSVEGSEAGGINITTTDLSLTRGGRLSASTFGAGNAGVIRIETSGEISIDGENLEGDSSGIFSQVTSEAIGNSGGIELTATNLTLTQGGRISASTFGVGNAGKIAINIEETIFAEGETQAGFNSGIFSQVTSEATGNSGGIELTTTNLTLTRAGGVNSNTFGTGNAGEITVNALGTIFADGQSQIRDIQSGIFSVVVESATGDANDIDINTNNLSLTNNAQISVESLGQGEAGNLLIQANSLALENGAALFASTPIGTGGSITLQIADNLTLRDNSTISAQAIEEADGGNIDIDAGFIVAFPNQNNDIIARAAQGTGGNIDLTTNALFGIEERSSIPPNNTNDIDPSSQFGLDGRVEINELEVNPAEALEGLPTEVIDVTGLIAQSLCQQGDLSEFIVTGKGGIAPSPNQMREWEVSEVDLVEPTSFSEDGRGERPFARTEEDEEVEEDGEEIVEAQGWIINDRGIVELVAHKTSLNDSSPQLKDNNDVCDAPLQY